jgi:hypothetical protein
VAVAARAFNERAGIMHKASRVRFGAGGRYRTDVLHQTGKNSPAASACDGERRWRLYGNRVTVGPAGPDSDAVLAALADASWLLRHELSGETALTYRGRPTYAVQVTAGEDPVTVSAGTVLGGARVVIDAETGVVLLLVSGFGGRTAVRAELRDVTVTGDEDDTAFQIEAPPGVKVIPVSGNPLEEFNVPDAVRTAAKTADQAARAAERGFTAAKGFFDSLRGPRR